MNSSANLLSSISDSSDPVPGMSDEEELKRIGSDIGNIQEFGEELQKDFIDLGLDTI